MGVFAGVMIADDFKTTFPLTVTNTDILGLVSSIYFIGAMLGSLLAASAVAGRLGRRRTMMVGIACNTAGALLCALSWHLPQLMIGRFVTGFGVGITSSVAPVLVAESVPAAVRGKLVTVGSSCNVTAYSLAGWINYAFFVRYEGKSGGGMVWRFPLAFQVAFVVLIAPALWLCTESPRWLLLAGRVDEAKNVLARLAGKDVGDGAELDDPEVTEQLRSIQGALREENAARVSGWDTLRCRDKTQNLRRVILSCGTQVMQQLMGINAVGFFMPVMFAAMGKSEADSLLWTAGIGTFYVGSILTSLLLVDSLGRRL
jgi:MFS family permease